LITIIGFLTLFLSKYRTVKRVGPLAERTIQVFVHLAYGFGGESWNRQWKEGKIFGINEPFPYGYYRADQMGCSVSYSQDLPESGLAKLLRLGMRGLLGFDLVHAWRNFEAMRRADVIWTHTESQFLSILVLFRLNPRAPRPKLIAQSIWLFDRWRHFSHARRWLLSKLIRRADILTVHSPENLSVAKRLFPGAPSELVLFGIAADTKNVPTLRLPKRVLNIISLGNDVHRDWRLLADAVSGQQDWLLKIASRTIDPSILVNAVNIETVTPRANDELLALYEWADLLVLALKPNLHASGATVIQEAALLGVPVVCSDCGGLRAYFSDSEVRFVPPQNAAALREAIQDLADRPDLRLAMAQKAQDRMGPHGLSSESFVRRHVEISRDLLSSSTPSPNFNPQKAGAKQLFDSSKKGGISQKYP
jgi:glycosyltransferase involved in cell wall biosynthesis